MKHFIVIPCYNEAKRLNLVVLSNYLATNPEYNICFINDGSQDNTAVICADFVRRHANQSSLISLPDNQGKAQAILKGIRSLFEKEAFDSIGFLDADLSTPLEEYQSLLNVSLSKSFMGIAKREIKNKGIAYKGTRIFGRRTISFIAKSLFKLPYEDTQCGAKVFSRDVAKILFESPFVSNWLFDLELILRFHKNFSALRINEYSLKRWTQRDGSKMLFKHKLMMPFEIYKIYKYY